MKQRPIRWSVYVGLMPAILIVVFAYLGTMIWTVGISFTDSRMLPAARFAGVNQYIRLFATDRWLTSIQNMVIFGVLMIGISLVLGFLLAVAIDQRVRAEGVLRTVILYPYAMSFIVTGLVWQWILNPTLGIEKTVRGWGFESFRFDWIVGQDTAIYCVVLAGVWHAAGLVMAIMLAGLRGIDPDLWKASRIDGIKPWRFYLHIVIPVLRPSFISATVLLSLGVVKLYDLVLVLTGGGPGFSSDVPAKFVMDYLFQRQNIGLATAAATTLLVTVLCVLTPWLYTEYFRRQTPKG
ncbi:carbohydrate ABC transporter permease [Rhizobium sp. SSA_523]|uniref:carbohydrate ABC transporter permease n=1 Tax=Rhizobium sp. SSA_523 TaxID=2952477 RepID=UPI002090F1D8|nr:sugar ABC transporter permease [Rhizobium sp. SSA_523]MCO5731533.1 sugar ABC transporter permease [Rhizobium sp. SSA_523]WKC21951.1 sugar ABC transporter permease [Rhizobium sp. SSA_523]